MTTTSTNIRDNKPAIQPPKRSLLMIFTSALMLLFSFLRFFFGLNFINFFTAAITFGAIEKSRILIIDLCFLLLCLSALMMLAASFTGMLYAGEPLFAHRCVYWGAGALILGMAGNLMQQYLGYGISFVAWTTGVIIPVLFLAAAILHLVRSRRWMKDRPVF